MGIRKSVRMFTSRFVIKVILISSLLIPILALYALLWITQASAERLDQQRSQISPADIYRIGFYYSGDDVGNADISADIFASLLSQETGFDIEASTFPCESGVVQHLGSGDIDIAPLSALSYVYGHETYGFEAEIVHTRNGFKWFRGQLNVQAARGYTDVWSLQGTTFAAPAPGSMTGYMAPYVLISDTTGIAPEDFFSDIVFSNHRDVILDVYAGTVDVGGSYDDARVLVSDTLTDVFDVVDVLAYTDYIPNGPWVFRAGLTPTTTQSLADGIVAVAGTATGQIALEPFFYTDGAAPIDDSDFDIVRSFIDAFGLKAPTCETFLPVLHKHGQ